MKTLIRGSLLAATILFAGCGDNEDPVGPTPDDVLSNGDLLVAIARDVSADELAQRSSELRRRGVRSAPTQGGDFYLAVRKSALQERWFWSVYLKEIQPFGPQPMTLGTRVVRFRVQNNKLYVFDADDRRATSDIFNPDLIIDAFPLVFSPHFNSLPGSGGYLLIDPAAGRNRFGALADVFASGNGAIKLETELSFVQNFKGHPDGGMFEQIFTAYSDVPIGDPGDVENNDYRVASTVGVNLRRYHETPGFQQVEAPPRDHYFLTDPINVPNTGDVKQLAVHWGFKPGMQPIKWVIGPAINDIAADPELGGADLFNAMKAGIESWNAVFGYQVFEATLAGPTDNFADDHTNYLIVDPDRSKGYAYADWRQNPNTGEIRGASVYFGGGFFSPLPPDATAANGISKPGMRPKAKIPTLVWQDQEATPPCVMYPPDQALTGAQKLEKYVQHVVAHEIGHVLGLRHNFKGSLVPPTSSVMEYNDLPESIAQPTPASYDHAAIAFLYGMSTALPAQPFCTDGDTRFDPNCVRFDSGSPTPLYDYQIPFYQLITSMILDGTISLALADLYLDFFGTELVGYARAGTPAEAQAAWAALLDGVRAPLADPATGPGADAISAWLYREVFLQPRGAIRLRITDQAILAAAANDAKGILLNIDGVRSYATRRTIIDALKAAQNLDSFLALSAVRDALAAQLPTLPPLDQAQTRDLIARIDAAIAPYFE
ncbi:MAG TPA: zinc-dependent metalloprotease [Kofleriaceae bacterium]|nr:zinc-dependent metalloprotease [Kofleriaceae bacterium]